MVASSSLSLESSIRSKVLGGGGGGGGGGAGRRYMYIISSIAPSQAYTLASVTTLARVWKMLLGFQEWMVIYAKLHLHVADFRNRFHTKSDWNATSNYTDLIVRSCVRAAIHSFLSSLEMV